MAFGIVLSAHATPANVRQNPVMVALRFFAKLRTRTQKARNAE
jgi:hypothetical protein